MITLSQAFKLLDIKNEMVYLRNYKDRWQYDEFFYSEYIKKYFDMKKIHVIKIDTHFTYDEESGKDYVFLINLSREEIKKAHYKILEKYSW